MRIIALFNLLIFISCAALAQTSSPTPIPTPNPVKVTNASSPNKKMRLQVVAITNMPIGGIGGKLVLVDNATGIILATLDKDTTGIVNMEAIWKQDSSAVAVLESYYRTFVIISAQHIDNEWIVASNICDQADNTLMKSLGVFGKVSSESISFGKQEGDTIFINGFYNIKDLSSSTPNSIKEKKIPFTMSLSFEKKGVFVAPR